MKTNIIQITIAAMAAGVIGLVATTSIAASYLAIVPVGVSCFAVAVLVVVAALDYRSGSRRHRVRKAS